MDFVSVVFQIMGITYLAVGIRFAMDPKALEMFAKTFTEKNWMSEIFGLLGIALGLGILANYNTWSLDWAVIVTFVGWVSMLKWISLIVMPDQLMNTFSFMWSKKARMPIVVLMIVIGLLCSYLGFFM